MGTRNLTVVYSGGELKVAQYGQWDGYPSGIGVDILNFLKQADIQAFKERLKSISFFTEKEIEEENKSGNPYERRPYLSRDLGADILNAILYGKFKRGTYEIGEGTSYKEIPVNIDKLVNEWDFGFDSVFCEWAYVIDLDNLELEVYKGFNKGKVLGRWNVDSKVVDEKYNPITLVKTYNIKSLPNKEEFLSELEPEDE